MHFKEQLLIATKFFNCKQGDLVWKKLGEKLFVVPAAPHLRSIIINEDGQVSAV